MIGQSPGGSSQGSTSSSPQNNPNIAKIKPNVGLDVEPLQLLGERSSLVPSQSNQNYLGSSTNQGTDTQASTQTLVCQILFGKVEDVFQRYFPNQLNHEHQFSMNILFVRHAITKKHNTKQASALDHSFFRRKCKESVETGKAAGLHFGSNYLFVV